MTTRTVALGSIAKITSGGTPERANPDHWNGVIPWVKTAQIQNRTITADDIDEWITDQAVTQSSARLVPKGTILMAMYGQGKTRGQVAVLGLDAAINQACAAIIVGAGADRNYVYQQLRFRYKSIRALSNTGSQENLNAELIREIAFPLPPIEVQRKIAEDLNAWDSSIERLAQLIEAKKLMLAALRQRIFSRTPAKSFVRVKLGAILKERQERSDGFSRVYSVSVHKGLVDQVEHLGRSFSAATTDHYNLVRPGDVVYTKSPTGDFNFGIVKQSTATEAVLVSPLYAVFTPTLFELGTLVDFFFESPTNAQNYLKPLAQKGAKNTISIGNDRFLEGEITVPKDQAKSSKLAAFISGARKEIFLLEEHLRLLATQKRGLMQKLLTGEWRLPLPEQEAL